MGSAGRREVLQGEAAAATRLSAYARVDTSSVDDAAEAIGRIFCPHGLIPLDGTAQRFFARHNSATFDGFSINYVAYGGTVSIDPGCLENFFLMQIPLRGSASISTAACEIATTPGVQASLLSPTLPTRMVWHDDCAQLILLIERRLVEQRAAALAGRPVGTVEFAPALDLESDCGGALQAQAFALAELAECTGPRRGLGAVAAADLREVLLDMLVRGPRHGLSDAIACFDGRAAALPRAVRRARDHLVAHATEPLDLERLAEIAGVGIRALQIGFRRHFGLSISHVLLELRLAQLNAQLRRGGDAGRVTDLAFDLGFTHLSRMASAYRRKFGETPSETLRRAH